MKIETLRHSLAHVMAYAVQELYPGTKFGIGPVIEDGFYYDFDFREAKVVNPKSEIRNPKQIQNSNAQNSKQKFKVTLEDLPKIEEKMREIIKRGEMFKKEFITPKKAKEIFKDQPYKLELIDELSKEGSKISIYQVGSFIDLCRGPHLRSTKQIPLDSFKLVKIAGAYWKGDENNPMLTRIYGVAFQTKKELNDYLNRVEEAKKRDHRILGQKLEFFIFDEEVGAGLPLWLPKGATLRRVIEDYLHEELKEAGYQWVVSPHIAHLDLWQTSGHWNFYRENIYSPIEIDKEKYLIKPMNCPFHVKIYNFKVRSYKDLPLRFAELGTVYRYEKSGVLHGLTRVRGFTQDDAHIFCTPDQLSEELLKTLKLGIKMLKTFGFKEYDIFLSTRPQKYVGSQKIWEKATNSLKYALSSMKLDYKIDPGGGVFYGPKIDIKIKDSLGRPWQCTTIQVDFNLPQRFKMTYIDKKGKKKEPIMIHRALLGSMERFIGVLLEHYEGALPFWLSPVQVWVIPIGSAHHKYAKEVVKQLAENDIRVELKDEKETVSKKIREGELQKIPYMIVVGDKEVKEKKIRVRARKKGDVGMMKLIDFIKKNKINKRGQIS
jgi:threonyl-tRNA synthetase